MIGIAVDAKGGRGAERIHRRDPISSLVCCRLIGPRTVWEASSAASALLDVFLVTREALARALVPLHVMMHFSSGSSVAPYWRGTHNPRGRRFFRPLVCRARRRPPFVAWQVGALRTVMRAMGKTRHHTRLFFKFQSSQSMHISIYRKVSCRWRGSLRRFRCVVEYECYFATSATSNPLGFLFGRALLERRTVMRRWRLFARRTVPRARHVLQSRALILMP